MTQINPYKDMNVDKRILISPIGWEDKDEKRYCNVFTVGKLIKDAETLCYRKAKVSFCVKFGNDGFLNCDVWEDSPFYQMAKCLEKGEVVAIYGTFKEYEGMTKHHEKKTYFDTSVQFLWPASAIVDPYNYMKLFMPSHAAPDVMESANDDFDESVPPVNRVSSAPISEPIYSQSDADNEFTDIDPDEDLPF